MAAGLGFKTFQTGEVLTAADTNGYLMQGILVFADAAARTSAITSPQEGQYSFLKDTNALEYYDGAAWVGAPVGDITAVNAGTGITGGGASGSVTITNDMATTITAAGDIVVGTGNGTYDNLPIGSTNQVLTADTTVSPYKVKWADAAAGSYTQLGTFSISGNQSFTSIPGTYRNLVVVMTGLRPPNDNVYSMRINNDGTSNRHIYGDYSTSQNISFNDTVWRLVNTQDSGVSQNITVVTIYEYANTVSWKLGNILSISNNQTTTTNFNIQSGYGLYNQTDAITSLYFYNAVGGTSYGTVTLYGVK